MYTIKEFAKLSGISISTLRRWDKSGFFIPMKMPSGHRRYTDDDLSKIKNKLCKPQN